MNNSDEVDDGIDSANAAWAFDMVPERFESHIRRSVPYYDDGQSLVARLSDFFLPEGALAYDVGSTTGSLARQILERHPDKRFSIVGIDRVPGMVEYAASRVRDPRASFICADALQFDYDRSHLFLLYYTLQFIHPSVRADLLRKIYEKLHWGGGLLLFEKVRAPDARFQDYLSQVYLDFKLENRFTPAQVIAKQRSLKGNLEPFSENGNLTLLAEAGFSDIVTVFKWVCFQGWLAIK